MAGRKRNIAGATPIDTQQTTMRRRTTVRTARAGGKQHLGMGRTQSDTAFFNEVAAGVQRLGLPQLANLNQQQLGSVIQAVAQNIWAVEAGYLP
jgi:hypothetical protein